MVTKQSIFAQASYVQEVDLARRANHPVAVINNDWAPTLAFAYSLGRQQIPLHFYGPGAGRWSRYCRRRGACPPVAHADKFIPWLQARLRSGEITRLAPTTDLVAYYMSVLREDFPAEVRRSIAPIQEVEDCLIKTRFADACQRAGQLVPSQASPDDIDDAVLAARSLGYPLIIKPKSHLVVGVGDRGRLILNESELRNAYRQYEITQGQEQIALDYPELRWPLLQRYLPSAQRSVYSVSGVKDVDRGILAATLSIKREQWPPDIGVSTVQSTCNDRQILDAGLRTVESLISCGIFELELLTDGDKQFAIDLNPRAFGFIMLDIAIGNDLPWLWWMTTLGNSARIDVPITQSELECRFLVPYHFGRGIRKLFHPRGLHSQNGADSYPARWISMVGHHSDPLPMLLANLRLLRLLPHSGGLVRPFIASAWQARKAARRKLS